MSKENDKIDTSDLIKISELIDFAVYLTGHDKDTIIQMYNNYIKFKL